MFSGVGTTMGAESKKVPAIAHIINVEPHATVRKELQHQGHRMTTARTGAALGDDDSSTIKRARDEVDSSTEKWSDVVHVVLESHKGNIFSKFPNKYYPAMVLLYHSSENTGVHLNIT